MKLTGQARRDDGYAMAALLVGLSLTAIMMTVVMPVWKQMARREKEDELIFRGLQYSRALRLFGTKYANASPPNLDVLVEQRFLRKKYKDPITNDDFQPVLAGQAVPGTTTPPLDSRRNSNSGTNPPGARGANPAPAPPLSTAGRGFSPIGTPGAGATGGVIGVVSKSKDTSIRLYNGRNHYNEWAFINTPQVQAPGGGGVGPGGRGGRGGPGGNNPTDPNNPFTGPGPFGGGRRTGGPGGGTPNPSGRPGGPGTPGNPTTSPFGPARPIQPPPRPK